MLVIRVLARASEVNLVLTIVDMELRIVVMEIDSIGRENDLLPTISAAEIFFFQDLKQGLPINPTEEIFWLIPMDDLS